MKFHKLLSSKRINLTPTQQEVTKYIIDHYEDTIFLTASKLARNAGVSEATVVRLAQALGFEGFPGMQRELRKDLRNRLSTVTRLEQTVENVKNEGDVLVKVMQEDIQNISKTLREIPIETFCQAVDDIRKAQRIFIVALRGTHGLAFMLSFYLRFLKKDAHALTPGCGDIWDILYGVGPEDLVIGISVPRYTRLTEEVLAYAFEHGARVGAITDSFVSPLAHHAHWVLPVSIRLDSFIESATSAMSLVNALITAMGIQDTQEVLRTLKDHEDLWKAKKKTIENTKTKQENYEKAQGK